MAEICKIHGTEKVCLKCIAARGGKKTFLRHGKKFYREQGTKGGRPSKLTPEQWQQICELQGEETRASIAARYGVSEGLVAYIQKRKGIPKAGNHD